MRRLLLPAALVLAATAALSTQDRPAAGAVYRVPVSGMIELGLSPFIARSIREAERADAAGVVLVLDTPGGRIDAAQRITDAVRETALPVIAWVDRRAFSAGAMIALATDSIFMRPGSVIGAATPVDGQSGQRLPEKYVSAMRAEFRALAEQHGIDPRIAEAMVDENVAVDSISPAGQLLTLATSEAVRLGVAKGDLPDFAALMAHMGWADAPVVDMQTSWSEALVRFLSNPIIASLLLSLGMLGLIVEVKTPNFGVAGLTGLACLGLFFGSHWIVGLAGWFEVLLIGAGLVAILIEIFLVPGFGVTGLFGLGSLGVGFFLSLLGTHPTTADLWQALAGTGVGLFIFVALAVAFLRHLPQSPRLAGLLHREGIAAQDGYVSATARADLVGKQGTAVSELRPSGVADIGGERVDVTTEGDWLPAGTAVVVLRAESMRLIVRRVSQLTA